MVVETVVEQARVLVLLNPGSGNAEPGRVREALTRHFAAEPIRLAVHQLAEGEDLMEAVRSGLAQDFDVIAAAGGDGTVSTVAGALVGSRQQLGIIPLGTTNVLARELGIPLDLDEACALLAGPHATKRIDALRLDGRHYFTQVGVGLDALMIRETTTESKKRFGAAAYVWTACCQAVGFQPRRFTIAVDGVPLKARASQIVLANCGALGTSGLKWAPEARVDDGQVEVCVVRAPSWLGYLSVAWSVARGRHRDDPNLTIRPVRHKVTVHTDRPLPVQADGEVAGATPIEVEVVPGALSVVVPAVAEGTEAGS